MKVRNMKIWKGNILKKTCRKEESRKGIELERGDQKI